MVNDKWGRIRNFETESCFSLGTTLGGRRDSLQPLQDRPPQKCTKCEKYECVCFLLSFWSIGDSLQTLQDRPKSKHLIGQLDPPVGDVTFLHHRRSF